MELKKILGGMTLLAAAAILPSACINDDYDPELIRLSVEGVGNTPTTRAASTNALQNTQFESGMGIQVEAYPTGGTATYTTGTYTTTSTAGTTAGSILLSGSLFYHPTSNIDICAYYPSTIASASTTTFTVLADQTTASIANYQNSDLMYATKVSNVAKGTTHGLTFNHALSKIIVNISEGTGLVASDITNNVSAVKINNTYRTANVAFGATAGVPSGVITATASTSDKSDITITGTGADNVGIVVPQTIAASTTLFTITYNSHDYTYEPAAAVTFDAGKYYTFNFTLNLAGLVLQSVIITDWADGDSGSPTTPVINL